MIKMGQSWMSKGLIKAPRNLVIDTIPLLLLLVGAYDPVYLSKFKRLSGYGYTEKDFDILVKFLFGTKTAIITPGVLSEASNFLENDRYFPDIIDNNMDLLMKLREIYVDKTNILRSDELFKIAFTDTSLTLAAKSNNASILTRDYRLWGICDKIGLTAYHLDHVLAAGDLISKS